MPPFACHALILEREQDLVVAAQVGSLTEARAVLPEIAGTVDVALVGVQLPDGNRIEVVRNLQAALFAIQHGTDSPR